MKRSWWTSLTVLTVCLLYGWASAADQANVPAGNYRPYRPIYPANTNVTYGGYGGYGGYGYGGVGTVASSNMQGMASVISAAGQANLANSAAANNWEAAYSSDLSNRLQATNTYFEMRRVNKEATEAEKGPPVTMEDLSRYAKEMAPSRLTASQLDPVTGEIAWPALLREARYDKERKRVDELFAVRETQGTTPNSYPQLRAALDALRATFVKNIRDYSPQTYLDARKFLDSLDYESRFAG